MNLRDELADELAANLNPGQRDVIEKIGEAGPGGLSTFGWATNWFTALFMSRKYEGLIVTGRDDKHAKLGPLGLQVWDALRSRSDKSNLGHSISTHKGPE